jgi:hypothetical protein
MKVVQLVIALRNALGVVAYQAQIDNSARSPPGRSLVIVAVGWSSSPA